MERYMHQVPVRELTPYATVHQQNSERTSGAMEELSRQGRRRAYPVCCRGFRSSNWRPFVQCHPTSQKAST